MIGDWCSFSKPSEAIRARKGRSTFSSAYSDENPIANHVAIMA